jgi:ribokinase
MRVAVVGHVEWVQFARVERVPEPGEIVSAVEVWEEPAGGGAVAAVQLANLNGSVDFYTALGDDELARLSRERLTELGVTVHSGEAQRPQRRAFTYIDADGERTITTLGPKLRPSGEDASLPWEQLARIDAVYFTGGDVAAVRAARRAKVFTATSRELPTLHRAGEELDAVIGSAEDVGERIDAVELDPPPRFEVSTSGPLGGWVRPGGPFRAAPIPGPIEDAYGCGDCFAAGFTYALGAGLSVEEAVSLAARCGATVLTSRGPYERQLTAADVAPA